jgi:hypothetical protein
MKYSEFFAATSLRAVQKAQSDLFEIWNNHPECLNSEQFDQLKQALRDMEDYFSEKVQIKWGE